MAGFDFDLVVIGAGSGGVRAARVASELGARVAICESDRLGGTCVNVGCVPKKLFVHGSHFAYDWVDAEGFGWSSDATFDWAQLVRNKDREIARLNGVYGAVLANAQVAIYRGRAALVDGHTVEIDGTRRTAERILIATGSTPRKPTIEGADLARNSNDVFTLESLPSRMTVVGGGYIAVEFASVFSALGVEVTLVHRGKEILRGFDQDLQRHLHEELEHKGVQLRLGREVAALRREAQGIEVKLDDGTLLKTDFPLFAIGRVPNTADLRVKEIGIELAERGGIVVDEDFVTSVPSVGALGDVIDHIQLTPVAIAEGMHFSHRFFGNNDHRIDYLGIPTAVFSQPEVGTVGVTEAEAWHRYQDVRVYKSTFTPLKLTLSERAERTMMKLVVDAETDRVVGCHMAGSGAAEIVQGLAVAMKCGATKAQFDATIGIHPTSAEEFVTMRTPRPRE